MSYSVKSIREDFKAKGVFYTDEKLARIIASHIPEDATEVYDPTCGGGNLLAVFGDHVRKYGQELNPQQAQEAAERLVNSEIVAGDTLHEPAFMDRKFKYIVANYPFSVKWDSSGLENDPRFRDAPCVPPPSKIDYAFIMHILYMLDEGGTASVLNFPGILYRGQREGKIRQWIVEQDVVDRVELFEGGYFEDTKVGTALIVFKKGRTKETETITFADHEKGLEREVSIDEIRQNDYNLSVNTYVQPEEPNRWADFDPVATERLARNKVLRELKAQLEFSKGAIELHEMMGLPPLPPMSEFIREINNLINQYL